MELQKLTTKTMLAFALIALAGLNVMHQNGANITGGAFGIFDGTNTAVAGTPTMVMKTAPAETAFKNTGMNANITGGAFGIFDGTNTAVAGTPTMVMKTAPAETAFKNTGVNANITGARAPDVAINKTATMFASNQMVAAMAS